MSRADIPVQCSRCRHKCMESEWVDTLIERKKLTGGIFIGMSEKTCPKCGCKSYYDIRPQMAWCWSTGLIEVGDAKPEDKADGSGAILIAKGPKSWLTAVLDGVARRSYSGKRLVPGVPEAATPDAALDALIAWHAWCAKGNGKKYRHGVEFIKEPS